MPSTMLYPDDSIMNKTTDLASRIYRWLRAKFRPSASICTA